MTIASAISVSRAAACTSSLSGCDALAAELAQKVAAGVFSQVTVDASIGTAAQARVAALGWSLAVRGYPRADARLQLLPRQTMAYFGRQPWEQRQEGSGP
jgi:hypothetical protein